MKEGNELTPAFFEGTVADLRQSVYKFSHEWQLPIACNVYPTNQGKKILVYCKQKRCNFKVRYLERPRGLCTRVETGAVFKHNHAIPKKKTTTSTAEEDGEGFLSVLLGQSEYEGVRDQEKLDKLVKETASKQLLALIRIM